jgi:long-chain fatty acid transport protein
MNAFLNRALRVAAALVVCVFFCSPVFAAGSAGIEVGLDSARIVGKGNAGVADGQDASTQIYNPAAMSMLPSSEVIAGTTILVPDFRYKSASGTSESGPTTPSYIPTVAMALKTPIDKVTLGFSVNSPYGLVNQYSSTGSFKYTGYYNVVKEIAYTGNVAYAITPNMSIAGGFTYADVNLKQNAKLNDQFINDANGGPALRFGDTTTELDADGQGYGWNAAIFWKVNDRLSAGAMYRSRIAAHVYGEYNADNIQSPVVQSIFGGTNFKSAVETYVVLPDSFVIGAAYDITDRTNIELDLGWTGWSKFKQFDFNYATPNAVLNLNDPLKQSFDDTISVNIGVTQKLNDHWKLMGGYAYFEKASTEADYSNVFPDGDRNTVTTGLEYTSEKYKIGVSYAAQFVGEENIDNAVGAATANTSIDGTYSTVYHILVASVSYKL